LQSLRYEITEDNLFSFYLVSTELLSKFGIHLHEKMKLENYYNY